MTKKVPVYVGVTWSGTTVTCDPDDVPVSKKENNCITWVAQQAGYTFTGVTITDDTGDPNGVKEWDAPTFSTQTIPDAITSLDITVSTMTVNDKFKDTNNHTYSITYTDPQGTAGSFDPGIKNKD